MKNILRTLADAPALSHINEAIHSGTHCGLTGITLSLLSAVTAYIANENELPLLLIGHTADDAERLFNDLHAFVPENDSLLFSAHAWEGDEALLNVSIAQERVSALTALLNDSVKIIVAPCHALLQPLPSPKDFDAHSLRLSVGDSIDLNDLFNLLVKRGYERTDMVAFRGEFSARGGIVDIYLMTEDTPFRIEFFGDEITDIRPFDVHTQRSLKQGSRDFLLIPAARETCIACDTTGEVTLLSYFRRSPVIVWHEFSQMIQHIDSWPIDDSQSLSYGERFNLFQQKCGRYPVVYAQELDVDIPEAVAHATHSLQSASFSLSSASPEQVRETGLKPYQYVLQDLSVLCKDWHEKEYTIHIVCASEAELKRLKQLLEGETDIPRDWYKLHVAPLHNSWILPECQLAVITEDDIFHRVYTRRARRKRSRKIATQPIDNIATITVGEYVVHLTHGIGQFEGIRQVEVNDVEREMVIIRYADDALLYVPLSQAHLIERYTNVGAGEPVLDTLGSGRWSARKRKAERAVLDLAADLLERQAQRASLQGISFSADTEWQAAFEKAFPYALTPDQRKAVRDTKKDMENTKPMDRLICGDVGFGKTEVAVRAAFKCAMEGKQTAVLVPTTVLALQHWHTFSERMAEYPVRVEMLSRFVPPVQQKKIIHDLAGGHVDVIIGTHRLLSREISFNDIGLIIVDEEQRFGVRHKEKLKEFRALADVLTLSATPIPRTLYQALTQLRDMSTILTPPEERIPVKTVLIKKDQRIIRDAIIREKARGGQVFFLHNRVQTIDRMKYELEQLVPNASYAIAHGQMHEDELADVMEKFARGAYDVLVCTMIIESGLDFPNANTIIVDRADTFGLADLYQLRGRVGRAQKQAYAYLIVPGNLALNTPARQRLKAILENTALGSGYAIAMKDLEIRGGGNVLGPQQSGHIASIGFTLYCKLLERAIQLVKSGNLGKLLAEARAAEKNARERGEEPSAPIDWRKDIPEWQPPGTDVDIHLPFTGNIPEEYVAGPALRLDLFRRIGAARKMRVLQTIEEEMQDRFGPVPEETHVLLRLAELRIHARERGITMIEERDGKVILRRRGTIMSDAGTFPEINPDKPRAATDIVLAYVSRVPLLHPRGKST